MISQRFAQYGDLEYVKCLASRAREGRGIAYVKYSKTSTALRAMEEINEQENVSPTYVGCMEPTPLAPLEKEVASH